MTKKTDFRNLGVRNSEKKFKTMLTVNRYMKPVSTGSVFLIGGVLLIVLNVISLNMGLWAFKPLSAPPGPASNNGSVITGLNPNSGSVDITGRIFNIIPEQNGIAKIQIYQTDNSSNNVVVSYLVSAISVQFSINDCVKVKGTENGTTEYANSFGVTISSPLISANSIVNIGCNNKTNPRENVTAQSQNQPIVGSNAKNYVLVSTWGSEGKGDGQFNHPAGIETDLTGQRIYVTDIDNNRIQVLDSDGQFITKWGTSGKGDGQFEGPGSIAIDDQKKIVFVSDIRNNRIQKFDTEGNFIGKWGSLGNGDAQFDHPGDIALDPANEMLYITDIYNNRIQKFNYNGSFVTKWGTHGSGNGQFDRPAGISIDPSGNVIYVSNTVNNRIEVFDNNGKFLGNWGSFGTGNAQFNRPDGIIFDPATKLIYVSDRKNNRVQVLDNDGKFFTTLTIDTSNKNILVKPRDVAIDSSGKVLVVDKEGNKIYTFVRSSNSTT